MLALSEKARRLPLDREAEVLGVSPDGARVLVREDQVPYLIEVETNRRQPLRLTPQPTAESRVSWSPDGKKVLYTSGENLVVATLEPLACKTHKIKSEDAVFGATEAELLAVMKGARPTSHDYHIRLLENERLVTLDAQNGEIRRTVLEYPLAVLGRPSLHPDGKSLALFANWATARTKRNGTRICRLGLEGGSPQPLVEGLFHGSSLSWEPGGRELFAVCKPAQAGEAAWRDANWGDLYAFPASGGPGKNLTRIGKLNAAWVAPGAGAL